MEHITAANLTAAMLLLAGVCGVLAALWKGAEALQHLTGADQRAAQRRQIQGRLDSLDARVVRCEERLKRGDEQFDSTRGDMTQMLTVLNALLMHFISGNDHDKLRSVKESLDNYLSGR